MRALRGLLIALLVIAILIVGAVLIIGLVGQDDPKTVTTKVDTADKGKKPDKKIVVPEKAVDEASNPTDQPHARDETPPGVPPAVVEAGRQQQDDFALKDLLPVGIPLAAPTVPGCLSRFLGRNYSSRRGVAPRLWVIHWAGMKNLPGFQDVLGLTAFGNSPQAGVSWHFNMDREGHCHYNVNVINKAWTEAGFNPVGISVEIINTGGYNDKPLLSPRGLKVLGKVIAYTAKPYHIPLRLGSTSGCKVLRAGIVDHKSLGACGGGHPDVGSYSLYPIIKAAQSAAASVPKSITRTDRVTCRKLNYWRSHGRRRAGRKNAVRRKAALTRRGLTCTSKGVKR